MALQDTVTVAIVAAGAAILGGIITAWSNARSQSLNEKKFDADRLRFNAEVAKLSTETERLKLEGDHLHQARVDTEKFLLDQEHIKLAQVFGARNAIYPQLLELVYRMRNQFHSISQRVNEIVEAYDRGIKMEHSMNTRIEGLWELTEDLYKYRVYIDEASFQTLHSFKRLAQDISVELDRASRPMHKDGNFYDPMAMKEFGSMLDLAFYDVEGLYAEASKGIRNYFHTISKRAGGDGEALMPASGHNTD